jgi:hypothetical protein
MENLEFDNIPMGRLEDNNSIPDMSIPNIPMPELSQLYTSSDISEDEIKDPNTIVVQLNRKSPIVVFWGTPNSGKTVMLFRLTRYLRKNGYVVMPILDFRPNNIKYTENCEKFDKLVDTPKVPGSTDKLNFMLLSVYKNGKEICQLLEAPGEHYFNEKFPNRNLPNYLHAIFENQLPKIFLFLLELNWKDNEQISAYSNKVNSVIRKMKKNDSITLVCPKANQNTHFFHKGKPEKDLFEKECKNYYKPIFNSLKERNGGGMFSMFSSGYDFLPFNSGEFNTDVNTNIEYWEQSSDDYPEKLWKSISKNVLGR